MIERFRLSLLLSIYNRICSQVVLITKMHSCPRLSSRDLS
jgi:hypothetical protein